MRRTSLRLLVTLIAALAVAIPGRADAVSTQGYDYYVTGHQQLTNGPCVFYTMSGRLQWDFTKVVGSDGIADYLIYNQRLLSPKIQLVTRTNCGSTGVRTNMTKVTLTQLWWYYSCSTSGNVSAQYPWGVGLTVTTTCGNRNAARYSTTYSGANSQWIQSNSGAPAHWDYTVANRFCVGPIGDAIVYPTSSTSDHSHLQLPKVCGIMK